MKALVLIVTAACAAGCTSGVVEGGNQGSGGSSGESGAAGDTGGGGSSGVGGELGPYDAGTRDGEAPDGEIPNEANCLQVRICVSSCMDTACVERCLSRGSEAGRMLFEQLQMCSKVACPDQQDRTCRCEAECIFPGVCADLQDMCAGGVADPACHMCA